MEEARTTGFPSPFLGGFGLVDICCSFFIRPAAGKNPLVNIIGHFSSGWECPLSAKSGRRCNTLASWKSLMMADVNENIY